MWVETDDTPVWMLGKRPGESQYRPVLVSWYNQEEFDFLVARNFGTEREASEWLKDFWSAYWRLGE